MVDILETFTASLVLATILGYLVGALPIADRVSRRKGIDIFSAGTRLAGASNVRKSVGNFPAAVVLLGDLGKGALTVLAARAIGLEGVWLLVPALAAIVGHWYSVFSDFRGGDALGTLGGIILALFPIFGVISLIMATVVSLGGQKMPYTSLLGVLAGYFMLLILNLTYETHITLTLGVGGLCLLVLGHAIRGHLNRRQDAKWDGLINTNEAASQ